MNLMPALIVLPTAAAAAALALRRRPAACRPLAVAAFAAEAALAAVLFARGAAPWGCGGAALLAADALSRLVCLGVGVFGLAAAVYALGWFSPPSRGDAAYWCMALLAEGTGMAAALADHLILLLAAWGLMGVSLYALASMGGPGAAGAAKKTMVMVGGSDAFLLLGAVLLVSRSGPSVHPPSRSPSPGRRRGPPTYASPRRRSRRRAPFRCTRGSPTSPRRRPSRRRRSSRRPWTSSSASTSSPAPASPSSPWTRRCSGSSSRRAP